MKNKIGVYVHIPFCKNKCTYCDFYSMIVQKDQVDRYLDALEFEFKSNHVRLYEVETIYFGGGTPSALDMEDQRRLCALFEGLEPIEWTIECNPESISEEKLRFWKSQGINRISMGVQSADNQHLKTMGRVHSFEQVKDAVKMIRSCGFENLNLDLIYGIAKGDLTYQQTLNEVMQLEPEHISTYAMEFYDHLGYAQKVQFCDDDEQQTQWEWILQQMGSQYHRYEISNFSVKGFESKHNMKYWKNEEVLALGVSSSGFFHGIRYHHTKDFDAYCNAPNRYTIELLSERDRIFERFMVGFRINEGVSKNEVPDEYQFIIDKHIQRGNLICREERIICTEQGYNFLDTILMDFLKQ